MVCSNCKSTDTVSIQGRDFCINCGQRIDKPTVAPSVAIKTGAKAAVKLAKTTVKPAIKSVPAVKTAHKTPVVAQEVPQIRIKTKPKPAPEPPKSKLIINHPTVSAPKITVKAPQSKQDSVAAIPARSSSKAAPLDLRSSERRQVLEARQAMLSKSQKPAVRLSDVRITRPLTPKPDDQPAPALRPNVTPVGAVKPDVKADAPALTPAKPVFSGEGSALVFAWKQLGNWRYVALALISSLFGAIPNLIWRLNVDTVKLNDVITSDPHALAGTDLLTSVVKYGAIAAALTFPLYLVHVWAANAITYAAAKSGDNRGAKWQTWAKASLGSLWTVVKLDLVLAIPWILVAAAEAALVWMVGYGNLSTSTRLAGLVAGNIVIVYAALALIFTRLLGGYAVVLANLDAREALKLGWRLYRKRTLALAVCGVIGGGISAIIYLPASALNYANRDIPTEVGGLGQVLGAAGFTALLSALAFVFVTTYFFKQYRRSVLAVLGHSKPNLLSSAQPRPFTVASKLALTTLVLLSIAIGVTGYSAPGSIKPTLENAIHAVDPS